MKKFEKKMVALTRRQRGKLKTLIHNIVHSEGWQFKVNEIAKEQINNLGVDFDVNVISMSLKIKINGEEQENEVIWKREK